MKFRQLGTLLFLVSASCTSMAATTPDQAQSSGQSFGYSLSGNAGDNSRPQLGGQSALNGQANTNSTTGSFTQQNRQGMLLPGESDVRKLLPQSEAGLPPPYGANMFSCGYDWLCLDGFFVN